MLGFSFSPGGLLLPYHLGVIAALSGSGLLLPTTPLAGSSAGAIAVASFAAGVEPKTALEASSVLLHQCYFHFILICVALNSFEMHGIVFLLLIRAACVYRDDARSLAVPAGDSSGS
jgi:hypothetical protein